MRIARLLMSTLPPPCLRRERATSLSSLSRHLSWLQFLSPHPHKITPILLFLQCTFVGPLLPVRNWLEKGSSLSSFLLLHSRGILLPRHSKNKETAAIELRIPRVSLFGNEKKYFLWGSSFRPSHREQQQEQREKRYRTNKWSMPGRERDQWETKLTSHKLDGWFRGTQKREKVEGEGWNPLKEETNNRWTAWQTG